MSHYFGGKQEMAARRVKKLIPQQAFGADLLECNRTATRLCSDWALSQQPISYRRATVQGIEGPCDMYVFHEFGIPTVLWGTRGANTHNPDEYMEIDSVVEAAAVLLTFVCRWCGVASSS